MGKLKTILSIFLIFAVLLNCNSTVSAYADSTTHPVWKWVGFEIIGYHKISKEDLQSLVPIHAGSTYQEDFPTWQKWCSDIKTKFSLFFTECTSVRYSNFNAYFAIEVIEPGYEYRNNFRPSPSKDIPLATPEIMDLYEKLDARLWELFNRGAPPSETSDRGYLEYTDSEMHKTVQSLIQFVPKYRANLLDVLENDKDINKRAKAANLLNWSLNNLGESIVQANRLLDDPNSLVRNNISRFTLHFPEKIMNSLDRQKVIDHLLLQLDRPSHGDRNKAIYNLLMMIKKFPEDSAYIKEKGLRLITYISQASVLSNVRDPALEILTLINESGALSR